jgi:ABC-type transport system substrate-binding protein
MKPNTWGRRGALAAALGLALTVAASGLAAHGAGAESSGSGGGSFTVYTAEPDTLYPPDVNSGQATRVLYALFSGLVQYTADGTPTWGAEAGRAMAESLESADQMTWDIALKEGWTFHNGEAVTAESFVRAWNWVAYQPNGSNNAESFEIVAGFDELQCADDECAEAPAAEEMSGLQIVDDLHFTVELKVPTIDFPAMLGSYQFYPLPEVADPNGDRQAFSDQPIGNGPFQMAGPWVHNQEIPMQRYADYAGEPAAAEAVTFRSYTSTDTAYNDVLAGSLDILDSVPPAMVASAESEFGERYQLVPTGSFRYFGIPFQDERFANVDIRRALSMAIDRDAIAEVVYHGTVLPARNLVAPVVPGSRWADNPCGEWCEYDPERAREMFEAAGGFEGTLTIWYDAGRGWDDWIEAVANMWRTNLGLEDIVFEPLDTAQYFQAIFEQSMDGPYRMGQSMNWPTQGYFLHGAYDSEGRLNFGAYVNAEVDRLLDEAAASGSTEEATEAYYAVEDLVLSDMAIIPQFWQAIPAVNTERVSNVVIDVFGRVQVADVVVAED